MAMTTGGARGTLADINVTPLVDVMLVLLIIFMVTATVEKEEEIRKQEEKNKVQIALPEASAKPIEKEDTKLVLFVDKDKKVKLGLAELADCAAANKSKDKEKDYRECLKDLETKLKFNKKLQEDKELYLYADRSLDYGFIVEIMAAIKAGGIEKLGMVTDPPELIK